MLNQTFTADNFRKIFDDENRRGVNLEAEFFPEVEKVTKEIQKCKADDREIRKKKGSLLPDEYQKQRSELNEKKQQLKKTKEELLTKELERISSEIAAGTIGITLKPVTIPGGKTAYTVARNPVSYFAIKQVQSNLNRVYGVKQSNRFEIISQLRNILGDPFPKYVIRTDVTDFYESIRQEDLLKKIDADGLLALPSRKIISQILKRYSSLPSSPTGIPRGIGISAYLAELYMRKFDDAIKAHSEVIYYPRYVDDMVVIFAPRPNSSINRLLPFVSRQAAQLGLKLNPTKTSKHNLDKPRERKLEYLGYQFTFGKNPIRIGLGDKTKQKYKDRIKRSFDAYLKRAQFDQKRARRLLVKRIEFLTGNTRLLNSKHHVMIGIFYSNSLLSNSDELKALDDCLKTQTNLIKSPSLRKRLGKFSFQDGFSQRRYHAFNVREMSQIVGLWKHES